MTVWLKQSTSVSVVIGPIWATADGALKADLAYNAGGINCDVYKNGTKADVTLANGAGDGYFRAASGEALYLLTLSTGHTDTLGAFTISLSATGYYMKPQHYMVVPANVWDSMFGADSLEVDLTSLATDANVAEAVRDLTLAGAAAGGMGAAITDALADANELQTDWADGGRLDLILDAAGSAGDPWLTNLPGAYGAGTAGDKLATALAAILALGASVTTVTSPVSADAAVITLVKGDDYYLADGRQLPFSGTTWPDITGATIKFTVHDETLATDKATTGTVTSAAACYVELPKATTELWAAGGQYRYSLEATLTNTHEVTLARGVVVMVAKYTE